MHAPDKLPALPGFVTVQSDGVTLAIKLTPRAARNEIIPFATSDIELRIKVTAPPVDAAANQALIELLAETLNCSRGSVQIVRGKTSRHKVIRIAGLSVADMSAALNHATQD
jgi:uncharacterized protein (TIGR00251 family)